MPRLAFTPGTEFSPSSDIRSALTRPSGDVLVVIFLRGAADGLNLVVPHGEDAYYALRPSLGIPRPGDTKASPGKRAIDLDGFFGLHPAMQPLFDAWQQQHLAIIHACGAPDESRSHFKAMELMERGVDDEHGPASGWIGRHLASLDAASRDQTLQSPLRAVGFGKLLQRSLGGSVPVTALRSILDFHYSRDPAVLAHMRSALDVLYKPQDQPLADLLSQIGQETLQMLDSLQKLDPLSYNPALEAGLSYPETDFGMGLKQIAMLIKAGLGLEVAAIDLGGWDTHFAQGSSDGLMANLARELATGLAALYQDLSDQMQQLSIVVMTEFGRRTHENGSLGTDHGHGSIMMLLGGHVRGGEVYAAWPGLSEGQLVGPGDLAVTTDYRDVLAEICSRRLNNPAIDQIFPGYTPKPSSYLT